MVRHLLPCLLALLACLPVLALGGCSSPRVDKAPFSGTDPLPTDAKTRDAEQALAELDQAIVASNNLGPAASLERQRALGPAIDAAVERCAGTRFENRVVYLQAQWRFNFRDDGAGVDQALDRLDGLEKPLFKRSGKALRVQHLLRQERRIAARSMAESVIAEVPEFDFLLGMLRWHERTGGTVDDTAGSGLDGVRIDPAAGTERWVLYLHFSTWSDQSAFTVARYLQVLGDRDVRLVPVVRDGSARRIASDLAALPGSERVTVLYCRSGAEADAMVKIWEPPLDGWTVLLDRDRRIAKVEVRPGDIAGLTDR